MENEDRVKKILNILGFPKSDAQVMEVRSLSKLLDEKDTEIARLESELADHKLNHNTQRWTELLNKRMDQITALESQVAKYRGALKDMAKNDCLNPQGYDREYISGDMAIDAGDRSMEGMIYREAEWHECGSCYSCLAKQALEDTPKEEK